MCEKVYHGINEELVRFGKVKAHRDVTHALIVIDLVFRSGAHAFTNTMKDDFLATNTVKLLSGMLANHKASRAHVSDVETIRKVRRLEAEQLESLEFLLVSELIFHFFSALWCDSHGRRDCFFRFCTLGRPRNLVLLRPLTAANRGARSF